MMTNGMHACVVLVRTLRLSQNGDPGIKISTERLTTTPPRADVSSDKLAAPPSSLPAQIPPSSCNRRHRKSASGWREMLALALALDWKLPSRSGNSTRSHATQPQPQPRAPIRGAGGHVEASPRHVPSWICFRFPGASANWGWPVA